MTAPARDDALRNRIHHLYRHKGWSMARIARSVGRSRERISVLLDRPERDKPRGQANYLRRLRMRWEAALVRLPRRPDCMTLTDLARFCHTTGSTVTKQLRRTGLYPQVRAQLRANKARSRKLILTRRLFRLAHQLGHTPTSVDAMKHGFSPREIMPLFGSWCALQMAAGLTPNRRGFMAPLHQRPKPPGTIKPAKPQP